MNEIFELDKMYQEKALAAVSANKYIVGSIGKSGEFSISSTPVMHDTCAEAQGEARRLAASNPGKAFVVLRLDSAFIASGIKQY